MVSHSQAHVTLAKDFWEGGAGGLSLASTRLR